MTKMRNIDDYKDRMTSPIGIQVTTEKSKNRNLEFTFIEPEDYFNEDMRKILEEGERKHDN